MAERLREVADHLTAARVHLFGQQAHVVDRRHRAFEGTRGLVKLSGQRLRLRQPERAEQEGSLLAGQTVVGEVAVDQAALVGQPGGGGVEWSPSCGGHRRAGSR